MSKGLLKIWLILWIVGLPLVHIHPEIDHAHGMPGHVHGGTFHSVLSNTPVCTYENHRHHHQSLAPGEPFGPSHASPHVAHGLEHTTYGFSVLNSSIDPVHDGLVPQTTYDGIATSDAEAAGFSLPSLLNHSPPKILFPALARFLSPRAPPLLFA